MIPVIAALVIVYSCIFNYSLQKLNATRSQSFLAVSVNWQMMVGNESSSTDDEGVRPIVLKAHFPMMQCIGFTFFVQTHFNKSFSFLYVGNDLAIWR